MGRRSLKERNIRKLTRMGSGGKSIGITLPIEIVRDLKWRERQKVVVERRSKTITIRDWPVKRGKKKSSRK